MTDDLDLEARLRAAIHAEAETADVTSVPDDEAAGDLYAAGGIAEDPSLVAIRRKVRTIRRRRRALAAAATVAVVVVGVAALPRLGNDPSDLDTIGPAGEPTTASTTAPHEPEGPSTTATDGSQSSTTAPTTSSTPTTAGPTTTVVPADPNILGDGFQPLWPFATRDDAEAWQEASAAGGEQPWHLDAEETAHSFTTGFLGFTEIDKITSTDIDADDARVGVGYTRPDGTTATAAVIHLMRFGEGPGAPWEVVGTKDTTLVLETPDYGTTARSPMDVAGYITGADETLRVQVRQSSSAGTLGESPPFAGGGDNAPWATEVTFGGETDPAVTVVVSTGGHVQDVERFAITGLRTLGG